MEGLVFLGLENFDWLQWFYVGLISNVIGLILNIILHTKCQLSLSDEDKIKFVGFIQSLSEITKINYFLWLFNFILPYYTLLKFFIGLGNHNRFFDGSIESYVVMIARSGKYDLGVDIDLNIK